MNHKPDATHSGIYTETNRIDELVKWTIPKDPSVDLATTPFSFPEQLYDHYLIPSATFVTADDLQKNAVVEGDPVMYSGLFVQTFDEVHTLEPIVRSGTLALIPSGLIPTPLQKRPGHVLLADAHAFGGNSGSPIFVDTIRFVNGIGYNYKLLGVISGEVTENADFSMNVTATIAGNMVANSGVSVIVPSDEILRLLDDPDLRAARDTWIAHQPPAAP